MLHGNCKGFGSSSEGKYCVMCSYHNFLDIVIQDGRLFEKKSKLLTLGYNFDINVDLHIKR